MCCSIMIMLSSGSYEPDPCAVCLTAGFVLLGGGGGGGRRVEDIGDGETCCGEMGTWRVSA